MYNFIIKNKNYNCTTFLFKDRDILDDSKLKKIEAELKKARMKRDEWDRKVKDLERKYREAENTCIHDMVHAANLSPEQLAELIRSALQAAPAGDPMTIIHQNEEDE